VFRPDEKDYTFAQLNHNLVIVGYGTTGDGEDFWLLINSFGEQWGYKGLGLLARKTNQKGGPLGIFRNAMVPVKDDNKGIVKVKSRCQSCPACFY
jgi:hypothetical protein